MRRKFGTFVISLVFCRVCTAGTSSSFEPAVDISSFDIAGGQYVDWWDYQMQKNDTEALALQSAFMTEWLTEIEPSIHQRPDEESTAYLRRKNYSVFQYLCVWKNRRALSNPKPLYVCNEDKTVTQQEADQKNKEKVAKATRVSQAAARVALAAKTAGSEIRQISRYDEQSGVMRELSSIPL